MQSSSQRYIPVALLIVAALLLLARIVTSF
jgi:hypothetical protein